MFTFKFNSFYNITLVAVDLARTDWNLDILFAFWLEFSVPKEPSVSFASIWFLHPVFDFIIDVMRYQRILPEPHLL